MRQGGAELRCCTGLSPGPAPRALFPVAVPLAASVIAHAAVVAALTGRGTARVVSGEPAAGWIEAPEPVNMEPVAPAEGEDGSEASGEPAEHPPSDTPPALVDMPPPDAVPRVHLSA